MRSAIYRGDVFHSRYLPKKHQFNYQMSMMYLDCDELDDISALSFWCGTRWFNPFRFKREDFHGDPSITVKEAVYETVQQQLGLSLSGPVRALTNWRFFGFNFNPLATYYCFDQSGEELVAIVAEVTNTPWLERKAYTFLVEENELDVRFNKGFTVSPFNPVNMDYHWRSTYPDTHLNIHIDAYHGQVLKLKAALSLTREELSKRSLANMAFGVSTSAIRVAGAIYWQALKLFVKGVPFLGKDKIIESADS